MVRSLLVLFSWLFVQTASAGSFLDLSRDDNKNSSDVTTLVAGGEVKGVQLFGIYDSTRYSEVFIGHSFALSKYVTATPYVGAEWLPGLRPKLRGMLITSAAFGNVSGLSVLEFAGNTGNFNLQQVGYTVDQLTFSLVRHSVVGSGVRIDWKATSSTSLYVRQLERRTTVGASYTF